MEKIRKFEICDWYYLLVVLGYFVTLITLKMRPGVFATLLMLAVAAVLVVKKQIEITGLLDGMVLAYFGYHLLSVFWLLKGGFPISVFAEEFTASVLPMVFYFVGKSRKEVGEWYRKFLIAILVLGIVGLVLYIAAPQFYNDYSFKMLFISKADAATERVRMNSVVGSTCLSFLSVAGMIVSSYFITDKKRKNVIYACISFALCLLFAVLSNQRSGLVVAAFVLLFINYIIFFKLDMLEKKYFYIEIVVIVVFVLVIGLLKVDYLLKFWYRIISLPSAISERSEQWIAAVNNMYSTWLGNGLGANGHKALYIEGAHVIADGGLVKLYCEDGIIGFSMYVYLIIMTLKKGFLDIRNYYVEIMIILGIVLQSIGSNMVAFQLCTPIFWFAMGRINNITDK